METKDLDIKKIGDIIYIEIEKGVHKKYIIDTKINDQGDIPLVLKELSSQDRIVEYGKVYEDKLGRRWRIPRPPPLLINNTDEFIYGYLLSVIHYRNYLSIYSRAIFTKNGKFVKFLIDDNEIDFIGLSEDQNRNVIY